MLDIYIYIKYFCTMVCVCVYIYIYIAKYVILCRNKYNEVQA
jgi:hypothetical protein